MKYFKQCLLASLLLFATGVAVAQTKVAVFNLQAAILNTELAQKSLKDLREDSDFSSLQAKAESLKADLESLRKESETKGMTWSAEQTAEHRKKMEYVGADLQLAAKKIQSEQQAVVQRVIQQIQPKVERVLKEVVEEEGYDLVLDSQSAYVVAPDHNITAKVTERLNTSK